jgi:hypothetical protein
MQVIKPVECNHMKHMRTLFSEISPLVFILIISLATKQMIIPLAQIAFDNLLINSKNQLITQAPMPQTSGTDPFANAYVDSVGILPGNQYYFTLQLSSNVFGSYRAAIGWTNYSCSLPSPYTNNQIICAGPPVPGGTQIFKVYDNTSGLLVFTGQIVLPQWPALYSYPNIPYQNYPYSYYPPYNNYYPPFTYPPLYNNTYNHNYYY